MAENALHRSAEQLAERLAARSLRIVFAESCTAGLVAATLGAIPGISQWLCGSAVTYRDRTKALWLSVSESDLAEYSAVSAQVAAQMASGVLEKTPEADLALSVTGHLGPDAPSTLDGLIYIGRSRRGPSPAFETAVVEFRLSAEGRVARQIEAAERVLRLAGETLV